MSINYHSIQHKRLVRPGQLAGNSKRAWGPENNFNGIYFHHNFSLKTGVSRSGLGIQNEIQAVCSGSICFSIISGQYQTKLATVSL